MSENASIDASELWCVGLADIGVVGFFVPAFPSVKKACVYYLVSGAVKEKK